MTNVNIIIWDTRYRIQTKPNSYFIYKQKKKHYYVANVVLYNTSSIKKIDTSKKLVLQWFHYYYSYGFLIWFCNILKKEKSVVWWKTKWSLTSNKYSGVYLTIFFFGIKRGWRSNKKNYEISWTFLDMLQVS